MTDIKFGRLEDLPLREAWKHEALQFTPWLAENIDHLSDAIGIPLELTGTEVAVETFSADILARNSMDDSIVLIENQLETTDHTHLGQIMTYLAGLEAQTVIWIAPSFREPHLSAIRWLNEHTADGFSFFAVKARVVRIADSPFAPIFEVVGRPDNWARSIEKRAGSRSVVEIRQRFYDEFLKLNPSLELERHNQILYRYVDEHEDLYLAAHIDRRRVRVFMASESAADPDELETRIHSTCPNIVQKLGEVRPRADLSAYAQSTGIGLDEPANWKNAQEWMAKRIGRFLSAFQDPSEAEQ